MTEAHVAEKILKDLTDGFFNQRVMSNLIRPHYVERLVVHCLGDPWHHVGGEWAGWDIENRHTLARLEVKQSAARQTWTDGPSRKGLPTRPIFDIAERTGYFTNGGAVWVKSAGRPADLYVFAWHAGFLPEVDVDHRSPDQWEFYILPEAELPQNGKSIGLESIKKRGATGVRCHELRSITESALLRISAKTPLKAQAPETPELILPIEGGSTAD